MKKLSAFILSLISFLTFALPASADTFGSFTASNYCYDSSTHELRFDLSDVSPLLPSNVIITEVGWQTNTLGGYSNMTGGVTGNYAYENMLNLPYNTSSVDQTLSTAVSGSMSNDGTTFSLYFNGSDGSTIYRYASQLITGQNLLACSSSTPTPTATPTPTPSTASPHLYVANAHDNNVSVIDPSTGSTITNVAVGNSPRAIVAHGNNVYVVNHDSQSISVIDAGSNNVVGTISLGTGAPERLAISKDGSRLYASDNGNDVFVIDTATNTIIKTLTGFKYAEGMAINSSASRLYVVNANYDLTSYISVLDTSNYSTIATINVGKGADQIAITPDDTKTYVTNDGGTAQTDSVSVIDTGTNTVTSTLSTGRDPFYVAVNSSGTRAYVVNTYYGAGGSTNSVTGTVSVINTSSDSVIATVPVGYVPDYLALSHDDSKIYVSNQNSNTVSVIDAATNTVVSNISTGNTPWGIAEVSTVISINPLPSATINEGDTYSATGSFTDTTPNATTWSATVDYSDGAQILILNPDKTFSLSHQYKDEGTHTITVRIYDDQGTTGTGTATVTVNDVKPTPGAITVSNPVVQVNNSITASATFIDPAVDTHTATWNWGDGTPTNPDITSGTVAEPSGSNPGTVGADSHTYTAAGVYTITLTVMDDDGQSNTSTYQYVSVYNPTSQGLFSAGQHFSSPVGADPSNPNTTGNVQFGLAYKYQGTVPTGDRQFTMNFKADNLLFNATTVSSLVISNSMATLTGTGTINGGSHIYNFLVTGVNGGGIRVQITDPSNNNTVIYDTQPGAAATATPTTLVTGNVIVHN